MNFIPNKHELKFNRGNFQKEERERREIILNFKIFCVTNVKYKEISWRVRKEKEKSNF